MKNMQSPWKWEKVKQLSTDNGWWIAVMREHSWSDWSQCKAINFLECLLKNWPCLLRKQFLLPLSDELISIFVFKHLPAFCGFWSDYFGHLIEDASCTSTDPLVGGPALSPILCFINHNFIDLGLSHIVGQDNQFSFDEASVRKLI